MIKIIYAFLFIISGVGILKYRREIKKWSGNFLWAEKYLGRGGTYLVLIISGLLLIFFGIIYPFGGINLLLGR